jgi:hypothetical protein
MAITGTDLVTWAGRIDATSDLPALIRRLILATTDAQVTMRAGEGVRLGGFDGLVVSTGTYPFVAEGTSVWEMGVTDDVARKAESDYATRSENPLTAEPAATSYVFVTPRRWPRKEVWAKQKQAQGPWKTVQVLDADDLEAWLSVTPAVSAWLTPRLRLPAEGVMTVERYWEDWAGVTAPTLSPAVLMAGWPADPVAAIREQLAGAPTVFGVASESRGLSAAFVASVLVAWEGEEGERCRARTLLVEDGRVWNSAVDQRAQSILVPLFDDRARVEAAIQHGHHVVVPLGRREQGRKVLTLDKQNRGALYTALLALGLAEDRTDALATLGRRSMGALRRRLSHVPAIHQPAWAHGEAVRALVGPVLAGTWKNDQAGDQEVLAHLSGRPYPDIEREVAQLAGQDDPPLKRTGTVWMMVDREDTWDLVARALTQDDLHRFEEVVLRVLSALDPADELPPEQRPYANLYGKILPHSGLLREELADTLALMGARSDEVAWPLGDQAQTFVDSMVRQLLAATTARAWASMAWVLPRLAEASPDSFLNAIERAVRTDQPPLAELFRTHERPIFGPSSPHIALLWALELLAWSPTHLTRACLALAHLVEHEPDQRSGNRPGGSLQSILNVWFRNTSASVEGKLAAVDALRVQTPAVAWSMMLALVPDLNGHAFTTQTPRWRNWGQDDGHRVPAADLSSMLAGVIDRLLADAPGDVDRVLALLGKGVRFTAPHWARVHDLLKASADTGADAALQIWRALRQFVARQGDYPTAKWTLNADALRPLGAIRDRLEPVDPVLRFQWLFSSQPALGLAHRDHDYSERQAVLQSKRHSAVQDILAARGPDGLRDLLARLDQPADAYGVGLAAGELPDTVLDAPEVLHSFLTIPLSGQSFIGGVLQSWHQRKGLEAVEALLTSAEVSTWAAEAQGQLLRMLPAGDRTWRLVEGRGVEIEQQYWSLLPSFALSGGTPEEAREAFHRFLARNRLEAAFKVARQQLKGTPTDLSGEEWLNLLEQLPVAGQEALDNLAYELKEILDELADHADVDGLRLAGLAWLYLPLYGFESPPTALTKELLRAPKLYAQMVATAFPERKVGAPPNDAEIAQQERASLLLHSLRGVPGQDEQGQVDGQTLLDWVFEARGALSDLNAEGIGDSQIGELLGRSPSTSEGTWPIPEIRGVIERTESTSLEDGFRVGRFNSRGVTSRALDAGGDQERALVDQYRKDAAKLDGEWPRTAHLLRELARGYAQDAQHNDDRADLTQDRWR